MTTLLFLAASLSLAAPAKGTAALSEQTQACIGCHSTITPGIVHDWKESRHAIVTPAAAMKKPAIARRISASSVPPSLAKTAVGCYECHSRNNASHADAFDHMGFSIHVVVTPSDCATCHPVERDQFTDSKKGHAVANLMDNPLYRLLTDTLLSMKHVAGEHITTSPPSAATQADACLGCHGTEVRVAGMRTVATALGDVEVPDLRNWPNQGVGRINPDGSRGSCSSCHPRHGFSIADARKPYTCGQCHKSPDVPGWDVYQESKHGNIFFSRGASWNMDAVPWVPGRDFRAPTCAGCHNSLLVSDSGEVIAERTHDFGKRMWVRIFGLPYAHAQTISGATFTITNADGLPLPTTFSNTPAAAFLISAEDARARQAAMGRICSSCHTRTWIDGHFDRFASTVAETNEMTRAATTLLQAAWNKKIADAANPFDEEIEMLWIRQWLFYANTARYASAMTGAPGHTSFEHGWWDMTENLLKMRGKLKK